MAIPLFLSPSSGKLKRHGVELSNSSVFSELIHGRRQNCWPSSSSYLKETRRQHAPSPSWGEGGVVRGGGGGGRDIVCTNSKSSVIRRVLQSSRGTSNYITNGN
ncbi:hypothetical protein ElyMa_005465600 [Elysia marginata]|uniref:Uncharacterized protein n=1 Tax=Elysia marginata TaxID=1093978 RepID=A0AAV4ENR3_9GAST|nr:hypothetical protein ElyMa_005465600 [Elysia marginata]